MVVQRPLPTALPWISTAGLFVMPLVLWAVLQFGLGFSGYYGQDSHAYLDYSQRISTFLEGGPQPGPFFWSVNFPLTGALLALFTTPWSGWLPLISALSFGWVLVLFRNSIITTYRAKILPATLFTFITLGISPVFIRAAAVAMSDTLAIAFALLTVAACRRFAQQPHFKWALLIGFSAGIALGTRYALAPLLLLFGLTFFWNLIRERKASWLLSALLLFLLGLLPTWWLTGTPWGWLDQTQTHSFSLANMVKNHFHLPVDGHLSYELPNLIYYLSPFYKVDYCILLPILLVFTGPTDFQAKGSRLSLAAGLVYLFFLAGLQVQNPRFILPAIPFLLLPAYPSWERLTAFFSRKSQVAVLVLLWFSGSGYLASRLLQPILGQDKLEKQIARTLQPLPPGPLYTFGMDVALPTHGVRRPIVSLWRSPIDTFETPGYVLFNPTLFSKQWANTLPMDHWQDLKTRYELVELGSFPGGWELYRIE